MTSGVPKAVHVRLPLEQSNCCSQRLRRTVPLFSFDTKLQRSMEHGAWSAVDMPANHFDWKE